MKKYKLIKTFLISAPIIVTPLLANSCNKKTNTDARYYVDALAQTLKTQLNAISSTVIAAATRTNIIDITSEINTAKAEAKKIATIKPDNIDHINLSFKSTSNLKVTSGLYSSGYTLTVYPSFTSSDNKAQQSLTTTLSLTLNSNDKNTQTITNTYDVPKGFKVYTSGLAGDDVHSVSSTSNGNVIYAGTDGGLSVGSKDGDRYDFFNYSKGVHGLVGNVINSIYASSNGSTIYASSPTDAYGNGGGISVGSNVGTQNSPTYKFTNYNDDWGGVSSIYASNDGNTIYAGIYGGVVVGTKQSDNSYKFKIFNQGLENSQVYSVTASSDGTIFAAISSSDTGVAVGTKNGSSYTFKIYTKQNGLIGNDVKSVYGSKDSNTIYVGLEGFKGEKNSNFYIGTKQSNGTYTFNNINKGLNAADVESIYPSSDGNTIYAGIDMGVSVGTKQKNGSYTFKNYFSGIYPDYVNSVYASSDGNKIFAGFIGGVGVSQAKWFTQNNLSYAINNYKAIALNNKNNN